MPIIAIAVVGSVVSSIITAGTITATAIASGLILSAPAGGVHFAQDGLR